jgi:hypothetical protein
VIFTEDAFVHIWERKFLFGLEKDIEIPWSIVDNYVFHEDRTFDSFIINLTTNFRYKIDRQNILPIKDDFKKLVKDFPKLSNEYKNRIAFDNSVKRIAAGKGIYSDKSLKWVVYFMLVLFIGLVLTKIFIPELGTTWSSLGVIGSALLFYAVMIKGQKSKK